MSDQNNAERAISFLRNAGALKTPAESPWPELSETFEPVSQPQKYRVDWERLFPVRESVPEMERLSDGEGNSPFEDRLDELVEEVGAVLGKSGDGTDNASRDWDRCAWYQPIHFFAEEWGIYIREDCMIRCLLDIARFYQHPWPAKPGERKALTARLLRAAFLVYFLHEHFHHKVECLGLRLHVVDRRSCYVPYVHLVYRVLRAAASEDQIEETLANGDVYRRLSEAPYGRLLTQPVVQAARRMLEASFPADPPGYRGAMKYVRRGNRFDTDAFARDENLLQVRLHEATVGPIQSPEEWDLAPRMLQSFFTAQNQIYTIVPSGRTPLLPFQVFLP